MTDIISNLVVDVHPSGAKVTWFLEGNCVLIASSVAVYFHRQMLLTILADGSTNSLRDVLYNYCNSRYNTVLHEIEAEVNANMR